MSTVKCCRVLEFDAGHRLLKHESKCAHMHGHRYKVELYAEAACLDDVGRVIDFSQLKQIVGEWIDRNWDHGFLLNKDDAEAIAAIEATSPHRLYLMSCNPTAENIALHLLHDVCGPLFSGSSVRVVKVIVWETPNCHAVAEL